jgi:hypothetical protein
VRRATRLQPSSLTLIALFILQFVFLAMAVQPLAARVQEHRGAPAIDRSARIAFGDQFADFIRFLDAAVPPDGRVVVPPMDIDSKFGDVGLMQYFLFPRQVVNCPSGPDMRPCIRSMVGTRTYILRAGEFPRADDVPPSKEYSPFEDDLGLYAPRRSVEGGLRNGGPDVDPGGVAASGTYLRSGRVHPR